MRSILQVVVAASVEVLHPNVPPLTTLFPLVVSVGSTVMTLSVLDGLLAAKMGARDPGEHCGLLLSGPHDPADTSCPLSGTYLHCTVSVVWNPPQWNRLVLPRSTSATATLPPSSTQGDNVTAVGVKTSTACSCQLVTEQYSLKIG